MVLLQLRDIDWHDEKGDQWQAAIQADTIGVIGCGWFVRVVNARQQQGLCWLRARQRQAIAQRKPRHTESIAKRMSTVRDKKMHVGLQGVVQRNGAKLRGAEN